MALFSNENKHYPEFHKPLIKLFFILITRVFADKNVLSVNVFLVSGIFDEFSFKR